MSSVPNSYVEPIPQKTTVALINLLVLRFSDFLNKFYSETEEKLLTLEKRIDSLDTVLVLLEKKLDSVPSELFNVQPAPSYAQPQAPANYAEERQDVDPQQQMSSNDQRVEEQPSAPPVEENDEEREKYISFIKLFKIGVPLPALRPKMIAAGLDPAGIEKYVDLGFAP